MSDALHEAAADLDAAREELAERERPREVASAYHDVMGILDRWEERATDWDDFEGYVRFREAISERLAELPEDLPEHEAFENADDVLTTTPQNPPSESDFEEARDRLAPAAAHAEAVEELESARGRYDRARSRAEERRDELRERVAELERLQDLGEVDEDAPVEALEEPIESYNDAARSAFRELRRDAPARDTLRVVARTDAFPLVPFESPPERLVEFVRESEAGAEAVPELLELAERSRASLAHDVADPARLKTVVGANRTYLEALDAAPLTVGWPPPEAAVLRWRAGELVAVLSSFAPEETVAAARELRELSEREDYDRLRRTAVARAELDAGERERLASGEVAADLEAAREELAAVEDALDAHPPR